MNRKRLFSLPLAAILFFLLCCLYISAAAEGFTGIGDYQMWAQYEGYPQGLLTALGINGINQDYFHSLPGSAAYASGKIVIGDSRSCQLGIYESRAQTGDFAVFAVWGGHYVPGSGTPVLTGKSLLDIEQCFQEQIRTRGKSTVFFFATVNDYDYLNNYNGSYFSAAVSSAEQIASMSYEYEGTVHHPKVIVIGFDGSGAGFGVQQEVFNRYLDSYNEELRAAVNNSAVLNETASYFTTVPEITGGGTSFISDGLHYSDDTLRKIAAYVGAFGEDDIPEAEVTVAEKSPDQPDEETAAETFTFYRIGY